MKGNLYSFLVLLFVSAYSINGRAQIINAITTIAGNGTGGFTGDGGPATAAELISPYAVAADSSGNIYICSFYGGAGTVRTRKISSSGIISTFAGTGTSGFSGDGGQATAAETTEPSGVAADAAGNVYINDYGNYRIRKVNTSGIITTIAGTGTYGYSGDGGQATAAHIDNSDGLASDPAGNLYFYSEGHVRKIATSGIITTIAGNGASGFSGDGGPATAAEFGSIIYGLAADGYGNVYIADYSNYRVRMINSSGIITTVAGNGGTASTGDGGPATAAGIGEPTGMVVDAAGNIYISDFYNNQIRQVNAAGIISTIAGNGTFGFSGDGGPATNAEFRYPLDVAVDASGNVFVSDRNNSRIRKIFPFNNHPPLFSGGHSLSMTVCENTIGDSINSLLAIFDSDSYQTEIWSLVSGPFHGTAAVADTMTSGDDTLHTHGMYYTPASGYSGNDSFKVRVTDGIASDTTTIHVTVTPFSAGTITGSTLVCPGNTITLTDTTSGGVWSSSNASVATVGSTGIVTGISAGNAPISYAITGSCGTTSALAEVAVGTPIINTIAGNGTTTPGSGVAATSSGFNNITNVTMDNSGNLYISDYGNNLIRKVNTSGIVTTVAGNGSSSYGADGTPATSNGINHTEAMAVDGSGNLFLMTIGLTEPNYIY